MFNRVLELCFAPFLFKCVGMQTKGILVVKIFIWSEIDFYHEVSMLLLFAFRPILQSELPQPILYNQILDVHRLSIFIT